MVKTIAQICRACFVQGKSIKAIVRELQVSRRTVRKIVRSEETEFSYERSSQPQPKIGPWRDQLDRPVGSSRRQPFARASSTSIRTSETTSAIVVSFEGFR